MNITNFFCLLILCAAILSCKKEEPLLEGETPPKYFYLVTGDRPNSMKLYELQSQKVESEDIFYSINKFQLEPISQIVEFRGFIYIFQKDSYKITIASADSLKFIKNLDWEATKHKPSSISFANATTGFISFEDTAIISVLDLTNFKIARDIPVKSPITFLDNVEQYILGLSSSNGEAIIIDSRTYSVVKTFWIGDHPLSSSFSTYIKTEYILCAGKGKFDSASTRSSAKLLSFGFPDFNKLAEIDINIGSITASTVVPTAIVAYGKYFGYISTLSGLLRFSLSNPSQIQRFIAGEFYNLLLDYKRELLMALSKSGNQTNLYILNPLNSAVISKHLINQEVLLAFPK